MSERKRMKKRDLDHLRPELRKFIKQSASYEAIADFLGCTKTQFAVQKARGYLTPKYALICEGRSGGLYKARLLCKKGSLK